MDPARGIWLYTGGSMFDSLDDQIKSDLDKQTTSKQRILLWLAVLVASILIFGGLYYGVRLIE